MQEPKNLDILKDEVKQYVVSGVYYAQIETQLAAAKILVDQNGSLPNATVIFDIDETLITEYQYMVSNDFAWTETIIDQAELITTFPAIPNVYSFFKYCSLKGIYLVILTSRRETYRATTLQLLKNSGYLAYNKLILRPTDDQGTIWQFKKNQRDALVQSGCNIILNIGDQMSDLVNTPTGQLPPNAIKLPNPFYFISCFI